MVDTMGPGLMLAAVAAGGATWLTISLTARELAAAKGPAYSGLALFITAASWLAGAGLIFSLWLCCVAVICAGIAEVDARIGIIPNLFVVALAFLALVNPAAPPLPSQASGAAICGALFWMVREVYFRWRRREGLGLGDVKLAAAMGALLGPHTALLAVAGAAGVTACWLLLQRPASVPQTIVNEQRVAPLGVGLAVATVAMFALRIGTVA